MASRRLIRLPNDLDEECGKWGIWLVTHYEQGGSPQSRAVSSHGIERDAVALANSKRAECIFCLELELDPWTALTNWYEAHPDPDYDIRCELLGGLRVDVKRTEFSSSNLIWPINKWSFFDTKQFDVLVLTKTGTVDGITNGYSVGWMRKSEFRSAVRFAEEGGRYRLTIGTPHVQESSLAPMDAFPWKPPNRATQSGFVGYDEEGRFVHYCQCGRWAPYGYGVDMREDKLGRWYCAEHRPLEGVIHSSSC